MVINLHDVNYGISQLFEDGSQGGTYFKTEFSILLHFWDLFFVRSKADYGICF